MDNFTKAKRLISEGYSHVQDKFAEAMMDIKNNNPELSHTEIMEVFQSEIDKFLKYHNSDRLILPKTPNTKFRDIIPTRSIPYGNKKKGN